MEQFVYAIVFNNKDLIEIKKNDWNVHELINKLNEPKIDWTPKKITEIDKLTKDNKEELLKSKSITEKEIRNIYSKSCKVIHNIRPYYKINQKYEYKTDEQEKEHNIRNIKNKSTIINEYNMLNHLHKKFYKAMQNHYILIKGGSIMFVVKNFRIINVYIFNK